MQWQRGNHSGLTFGSDENGTQAALAGWHGEWHWVVYRPFGHQVKGTAVTKAEAKRAAAAAAAEYSA